MTIKKNSCFLTLQNLLESFKGYMSKAVMVYSNSPSTMFQVVIVSFAFIYIVAQGVLDIIGMLIFSILTCNVFSKCNAYAKHDLEVRLDYKRNKTIVRNKFSVVFFCIILQFLILAAYCPTLFTRNVCGEAILWACVTTISIILHDSVRMFYQTFSKQSKIRLVLKILTTRFMGKYIPLGSLLVYIIYLPYLCLYGFLFFMDEKINNATLTGLIFLTLFLIVTVLYLYYRLAIYLTRKVYACTL